MSDLAGKRFARYSHLRGYEAPNAHAPLQIVLSMKNGLFLLVVVLTLTEVRSQDSLPMVVSGRIERMENFKSKYVTARNVDIWLPEGYSQSEKYPVLYMHDGQMLFDPEKSWNKQAWNVDDVASRLFTSQKITKFIVVGIWNGGQTRHTDYFPQQPFEKMTRQERDTIVAQLQRSGRTKEVFVPRSDNYLKFIVRELKPYIDKTYAVDVRQESTFLAGSSMGGLISIYGICEYPGIFGGAVCMSTHWPGTFTLENNPAPDAFLKYLNKKLPAPDKHRIYFDCGDQTLDALYPDIQKKVDRLMVEKGYSADHWQTGYFPGKDHSEQAWNERLDIPLEFLFK